MKISEKRFWEILAKHDGVYAATATAISKEINQKYSRTSVKERAERDMPRLNEIREALTDFAETQQKNLMKAKNMVVRQRAVEFYLERKGKKRGWLKKSSLFGGPDDEGDQPPAPGAPAADSDGQEATQVIIISGKKISFT